jgi:hypothetical protein
MAEIQQTTAFYPLPMDSPHSKRCRAKTLIPIRIKFFPLRANLDNTFLSHVVYR